MTSRILSTLLLVLFAAGAQAGDGVDQFDILPEPGHKQSLVVVPSGELAARCGTEAPPPEVAAEIEHRTQALLEALPPAAPAPWLETQSIQYPTTVKVNFHIIRSAGGAGDVSDANLDQQIAVLNSSYQNRGFQFVRNSVDRVNDGNCHTLVYNSTQETNCKQAYINSIANNPDGVLNFYVAKAVDVNNAMLLGWARWPWELSSNRARDGVVIHYDSMPGGGLTAYNLGDTAVHEIGHWLGLYHTFQNGCSTPGDSVDDTPYEATGSHVYTCVNRDTCPSQAGLDPIYNFMDYTADTCMTEFTTGQANRMVTHESTYRPALKQAQISGSGTIFAGKRLVDISWKGMLTANVDVFRDGVKVVSATPNDGYQTEWFFGSAYSYNYWVCNAGSTTWYDSATCSNVTTVYITQP